MDRDPTEPAQIAKARQKFQHVDAIIEDLKIRISQKRKTHFAVDDIIQKNNEGLSMLKKFWNDLSFHLDYYDSLPETSRKLYVFLRKEDAEPKMKERLQEYYELLCSIDEFFGPSLKTLKNLQLVLWKLMDFAKGAKMLEYAALFELITKKLLAFEFGFTPLKSLRTTALEENDDEGGRQKQFKDKVLSNYPKCFYCGSTERYLRLRAPKVEVDPSKEGKLVAMCNYSKCHHGIPLGELLKGVEPGWPHSEENKALLKEELLNLPEIQKRPPLVEYLFKYPDYSLVGVKELRLQIWNVVARDGSPPIIRDENYDFNSP